MALYVRVLGHVFASRFNGDNNFFFALVFLSRLECFFFTLCSVLPLWSAWQIVQHNNKHTTTCNNKSNSNSNSNENNNKCATESNNDNNHKSESLSRWLCCCRSCRTLHHSPSPHSFALCVLKPQTPSIRMPLCYVGCCSRCLGHDLIKVLHVLSRFYSLPTSYSLSLHLKPVSPYPTFAPSPPPLPLPTLTGP